MTKKELAKKVSSTRDTIITECIASHHTLNKVYPHSGNSLRIAVVRYKGDTPVICYAIQKFGTKKSGSVDNASAGGVYSKVELDTGNYKGVGYKKANIYTIFDEHPDTGVSVQGTIPNWESTKSMLVEICNYIPQIIYMGIDLIVTEEGFKIIEINSHQSIAWLQREQPLLKDNKAAKFFQDRLREL